MAMTLPKSIHPLNDGVLAHEYIHPVQFFTHRRRPETGSYRLMYEILDQAIRDYNLSRKYERIYGVGFRSRDRVSTTWLLHEWFFSDRLDYVFSFVNICDAFDLDPHFVRRRLQSGTLITSNIFKPCGTTRKVGTRGNIYRRSSHRKRPERSGEGDSLDATRLADVEASTQEGHEG